MGFQQVAILVFLLAAGVISVDYDYSIYTADTFEAFCGNDTHKRMEIVFRGDAIQVYAPERLGCYFTEVEPAQFEIHNAMTDPVCYPDQQDNMQIYSLGVIIQKSNVHKYDDPFYMVTCSYELKGSGSTQLTADTSGGGEKKTPLFITAVNATSQSTFDISVRDSKNKPITSVRIGAFMQLVIFMTPAGNEVSFRVLKCFAFSNSSGVYAEYDILVDGCGDGDVIRKERGFLTREMTSDAGVTMRVAKSVYFRAFSLAGNSGLAFECEYIITTDTSADGTSCALAPMHTAGKRRRRKRRSPRSTNLFDTSSVLNMNTVVSDWITLLPQITKEEGVLTYSLRDKDKRDEKEGGQTRKEIDGPIASQNQSGGENPGMAALMMAFLKTLQQGVTGGTRPMQPPGAISMDQTPQGPHHTVEGMLQQPLVICLIVACVLFFTTPITVVIMVHQFQRGGRRGPQQQDTACYKRMPYQRLAHNVGLHSPPSPVMLCDDRP